MKEKIKAFEQVLIVMDKLRKQCPWDRVQTKETLRTLTIEETYELAEGILNNNTEIIKEELGDLLLHIVFYAKIGEEDGDFDIAQVCNDLVAKLKRRHPHIYGNVKVKDQEDVKQNWEIIKLKEKTKKSKKSVLSGVPTSLPALIKAIRIQEKARNVGFDWDRKELVWKKMKEELLEFENEINKKNKEKNQIEAEFGDILFSLVNYARFYQIDPYWALEKTNIKFINRFNYIEKKANELNIDIDKMELEEMEKYWEEAKK